MPPHRYRLTASYSALSAGADAALYDLLHSVAPVASLKDSSAAAALDRLVQQPLQTVEDVCRVGAEECLCNYGPLKGSLHYQAYTTLPLPSSVTHASCRITF